MTTLSTILVNFNHSKFLPVSLGSVLAQSRRTDELIIIDDASTDHSVSLVERLLRGQPNARLITNTVNQGCVANVNAGLRLARGRYIHFAAADDVFYPTMYEKGLALLEQHDRAALFTSRSDVIDEAGRDVKRTIPGPGHPVREEGYVCPDEAARVMIRDDGWFMGNTALFKRQALLDEDGFPEELASFADGYACRVLALKHGACFSPERLSAWRRLSTGFATSTNRDPEKARALITAAEERMRNEPIFPRGYAKRWRGRQEFEIKRSMLARAVNDPPSRKSWQRSLAKVNEKLRAAILLVKCRPWDIPSNIRDRLNAYRGLY